MGEINNIYKGYTSYEELISFIENENIGEIKNFKLVRFKGEYYGIGSENPHKQIIIGKEIVWYTDELGYKIKADIRKYTLPYKINGSIWIEFTDKLYLKLLDIDSKIELYNIRGIEIIKCENPKNCYFLALATTFCDYFYNKEQFKYYNYSSIKNKALIQEYLYDVKDYRVIEVNPFKSRVKIQLSENIIETDYRPIFKSIYKDEKKIDVICAFIIRPIINKDKQILPNEKIGMEDIEKLKKCDINTIRKIFDHKEKMISLANNIELEIHKEVIEYLLHNDINMKDYITNLDRKRINQILSIEGECIKYFENPSQTMIRVALENNPKNIIFIKNFTLEEFKIIIEEYRECIKYISNMSNEIQKYILEENIDNIEYFTDCSDEIIRKYGELIKTELIKTKDLKNKVEEFKANQKYINNTEHMSRAIDEYKLSQRYKSMFYEQTLINGYDTLIINSEEALDSHINFLAKKIQCSKIEIASGFVYKSGLVLLEKTIENILQKGLEIKIIMGNLFQNNGDNIDKGTADYINKLIQKGIRLRTLTDRFYHGKIYIMYGEHYSCVIIGSSNVSKGGFYGNFETNVLFIIENSSQKLREFQNYYEYLWDKSYEIEQLNLEDDLFWKNEEENENEIELGNSIAREFDYLRAENPDKEIKSVNAFIGCIYNSDYTAFHFEKYNKLLILESLKYQNAIYVYQEVEDVDVFLHSLKTKESSMNEKEYRERINHSEDGSHKGRVISIINEYK